MGHSLSCQVAEVIEVHVGPDALQHEDAADRLPIVPVDHDGLLVRLVGCSAGLLPPGVRAADRAVAVALQLQQVGPSRIVGDQVAVLGLLILPQISGELDAQLLVQELRDLALEVGAFVSAINRSR
jgi:hypothetical protein